MRWSGWSSPSAAPTAAADRLAAGETQPRCGQAKTIGPTPSLEEASTTGVSPPRGGFGPIVVQGVRRVALPSRQDQREATFLKMDDFRLAAWLAWMTPLVAALSSSRPATRAYSCAFAVSPASVASRKRRTAVLRVDFTDLLRSRAA